MRFFTLGFVLLLGMVVAGSGPVFADGAASGRNILLTGAAAAGTLLTINHNRLVHEQQDEAARRQTELEAERNQAVFDLEKERRARAHEAVLNAERRSEISRQHAEIVQLSQQAAVQDSLRHEVARQHDQIARLQQIVAPGDRSISESHAPVPRAAHVVSAPASHPHVPQTALAYGWGAY
ncbi:MAG TPA: hypothetical protein VGZ00_12630 [Candidatus Baltobacteraceae bacterium]|nr:hypothetical protein [Candidatus Baltobacteraceae bacterium]